MKRLDIIFYIKQTIYKLQLLQKKKGPTNKNKELFKVNKKAGKKSIFDIEDYPQDYNNNINLSMDDIDNNEISILYKVIDENNFLFQYLYDINDNIFESNDNYPKDIINDINVKKYNVN